MQRTRPDYGAPRKQKPVSLALQGGGAHGAFAWGVLDKLLEDGRLSIDAMSATSAGAMNAVVAAYGAAMGGAEGARAKLSEFWGEVSRAFRICDPLLAFPWYQWLLASGLPAEFLPGFFAAQSATHAFSPYLFNPFNYNPLKQVLLKVVDFAGLAKCGHATRLFLSATNVRSGKIKLFDNATITVDAVLASACLPHLFQAIEIDGEHFWDGGFMGNPAVFPLIYHGRARDIVIIHSSPIERPKLPRSAAEIFDRMSEISFNSSLMREMRAVAFVTKLIDDHVLDGDTYRRMLMHAIRDDAALAELATATKLCADWDFLCQLRDAGRRRAHEWLELNFDKIGVASSVDLQEAFL
jgi:NTE family protein